MASLDWSGQEAAEGGRRSEEDMMPIPIPCIEMEAACPLEVSRVPGSSWVKFASGEYQVFYDTMTHRTSQTLPDRPAPVQVEEAPLGTSSTRLPEDGVVSVRMTFGDWLVLEDEDGEYFYHVPSSEICERPPHQLKELYVRHRDLDRRERRAQERARQRRMVLGRDFELLLERELAAFSRGAPQVAVLSPEANYRPCVERVIQLSTDDACRRCGEAHVVEVPREDTTATPMGAEEDDLHIDHDELAPSQLREIKPVERQWWEYPLPGSPTLDPARCNYELPGAPALGGAFGPGPGPTRLAPPPVQLAWGRGPLWERSPSAPCFGV